MTSTLATLRRALEADRVLADDEGGVDLAEAALERTAEVLDLEADSGVHRVELPGAGRGDRQCLRIAHLYQLLALCIIDYSSNLAHYY